MLEKKNNVDVSKIKNQLNLSFIASEVERRTMHARRSFLASLSKEEALGHMDKLELDNIPLPGTDRHSPAVMLWELNYLKTKRFIKTNR